jgi:hypothetical protein
MTDPLTVSREKPRSDVFKSVVIMTSSLLWFGFSWSLSNQLDELEAVRWWPCPVQPGHELELCQDGLEMGQELVQVVVSLFFCFYCILFSSLFLFLFMY